MKITIHPVRGGPDVARVAALAHEIWHEFYAAIITTAQIDYMLEHFQSEAAIVAQLSEGYRYFLVAADNADAGYFAVRAEPDKNRLFISKLYARCDTRGQGVGRAMLNAIEALARQEGFPTLYLTVNKHNPTLSWYERRGFQRAAAFVADIGGGYVMDDFRMEKRL